ncbi:MAG TPA: serine/threonine-protein kinase [Polyangiales bacterium]
MGSADMAAAPADLVGSVVAGRYRILDLLREGAMGVVYAAWHEGLDQRVALKVLRRTRDGELDPVARQRFQREARAAARVQSDYICRVLDTGVLDDDTPFLVMEYLEGRDLEAELTARGLLPIPEAVRYVRQACAGLAEAHRAGIVHRDLKPANLFLQEIATELRPEAAIDARLPGSGHRARRLKLLDFGISKSARPAEANISLTRTSTLLGSPVYMSPEQLNSSRDVDARGDVWALGVILYELITGAMPFEADSIAQLVNAVLYRQPTPCSRHRVDVPLALQQVLAQALQKDRAHRYQSVLELAAALAPFEQPLAPGEEALQLPSEVPAPIPFGGVSTVSLPNVPRGTLLPSEAPRGVSLRAKVAVAAGVVLAFGLAVHGLGLGYVPGSAAAPHVLTSSALRTDRGLPAGLADPTSLTSTLEAEALKPASARQELPFGKLPPEEPWLESESPPARAKRSPRAVEPQQPVREALSTLSNFGGRR